MKPKTFICTVIAILLIMQAGHQVLADFTCAAGCTKCFGDGADECTECDQSTARYLDNFSCVLAGTGCSTGYTVDTEDNICKVAKYETDYVCPAGTYNPTTVCNSADACQSCDGGKYCFTSHLSTFTGACQEGYYCTSGAIYKYNDDDLASGTGGNCGKGYFCPSDSSDQTECTPGSYCSEEYLSAVSGDCPERYYCMGGTSEERPSDETTEGGDICPVGNYCPEGSVSPTICDAGTYQPNEGAASSDDCLSCPPGYYCSAPGRSAPDAQCTQGFYCPGGNVSPTPAANVCAVGYYCPTGSVQQILCDETDYVGSTNQAACLTCADGSYCFDGNTQKSCEKGYYCPGDNKKKACFPGKYGSTTGQTTEAGACDDCPAGKACELYATTTNYKTCKAGYYCQAGSISPIPKDNTEKGARCAQAKYCPEGSTSETSCPGGKYCDREGLSEPTGNCESGYYCTGSTTQQNPRGTNGNVCPDGNYCPEGSSSPTQCPIGTYRDEEGGETLSDCYECPHGYYCETAGLATPGEYDCPAGYYCVEGETDSAPTETECPAGSKCPLGSMIPIKCEMGKYQDLTGQSSCKTCTAGNYCPSASTGIDGGISSPITCPLGYYCESGTAVYQLTPCPEGYYGGSTGLSSSGQCTVCPVGYYCDQKGQTTYTKQIPAGYYSTQTAQVAPIPSDSTNVKGRCEVGHYCPEGSGSLTACPAGTYNDARSATSENDCLACPAGYYCNASGKTFAQLQALGSPSFGTCTAGYVCSSASTTPTPTDNIVGKQCPVGHYCPAGTHTELECPSGTYSPNPGASSCTTCPAGEYCDSPGMASTNTCRAGRYCPSGSVIELYCPYGTYNPNTGSDELSDCLDCTATHYCDEEGMTEIASQKKCAAGYLCVSKAEHAYPIAVTTSTSYNRKCPPGHSCSIGAASATECTTGYFQNSYGASSCKVCPPGYYCSGNARTTPTGSCAGGYMCYEAATTNSPTDGTTGAVCPVGSYCTTGSAKALVCEDGTKTTATTQSSCSNCIAGKYCTGSEEFDCPTRRYCVAGSVRGELCEAGTYNEDNTGHSAASQCDSCSKNLYCIDGIDGSGECEAGYVCNGGSATPQPTGTYGTDDNYICPTGYYCLKVNDITDDNAPLTCSSSKYTYELGSNSIDDCLTCGAGYYCPVGAVAPISCPAGAYCLRGSTTYTECPINTIRTSTNGENERDCRQCSGGYFCDEVGLTSYSGKQCSTGHFCPIGTSYEVPCPAGTYLPYTTRDERSDCITCTQHYYCPEGSSSRIMCTNGQVCDTGSSLPELCEAGYICTSYYYYSSYRLTNNLCSAGYYCEQGTTSATACTGYSTTLCPTGSKYEGGQFTSCPAGYYLSGTDCKYCEKGYVCSGGAIVRNPTTAAEGGYICPRGYYCDPEISVSEIGCPIGTYNPYLGQGYESDCLSCEVGFYNPGTSSSYCFECGNGATSNLGASECYCRAAKKDWYPDKNQCVGQRGYSSDVSYNKFSHSSGEYNNVDSVAIMCDPACPSGEHCNLRTIECESNSCPSECPNGGTYSEDTGTCACDDDPATADAACDSTCQTAASSYYYDSSQGSTPYCCNYNCQISTVTQIICKSADDMGIYTPDTPSDGALRNLMASADGAVASYQCPSIFFDSGSTSVPSCATDIYSARRYLTSKGLRELQALADTYEQSIICLTAAENTVSWEVSTTTFPVYYKDHPVNDDYTFDDSAFDTLKSKLINGGVSVTTFVYSFSAITEKIPIVFNDYSNSDKITVVATNQASCASDVMPLNDANLALVGIDSASFLSLTPMEDWLIVFPLLFLAFACGFGALLKFLEIKYHKYQLKKAIERQQQEFIKEDGTVDRIQYLKDLYNVIKHYLNEMSDQDPIQGILDSENNEVDNRQKNEEMRVLEAHLREFFEDLRFNDGELVEDKAQGESTDGSDNEDEGESVGEGESDEEFHSGLDPDHPEGESQEGDPLDLDQLLLNNDDKIEEAEDEDEINDDGINAEIALNLDKDMERDRREFLEGLNRLGLSEEDKRILLERYEDSLRRARDMMKGDAAAQERARLAKLEERKNKQKDGKLKLRELEEKEKEVYNKYRSKIEEIDGAIEQRVANINDELVKEEEEQRRALDKKSKERMKKFKDNFYSKIKGKSGNNQKRLIADHERDNERLLKDLERERAYQEKKMLKERDARRKKKIEETTKDLSDIKNDIMRDQADELEEVERQRLMIYAEHGLEDEMYGRPLSKEEKQREADRRVNHIKEIELMRLKQHQRFEKKLINDIVPEDEEVENLEAEIDNQRRDFKDRIANASTEDERQRLLKELEGEKEQEWAEELEKQRQIQEQARFERQKRRQLYKERNNLKLNSKHRDENLKKELELMAFDAFKREEEAMEKINDMIDKGKGDRDLPLKVYKQLEDMTSQRLDDQTKMNFYEISGKLSNLYTDIAFERALAKKNLEEDMNDKVKELDEQNISNEEFQREVSAFQKELEHKGKEQERDTTRKQLESEMDIRSKLTEDHSTAKKELEEELYKKKQQVLEKLGKDFRNEGILKLLMERNREDLENRLLKIAEEREEQQYKTELELVARTNKDLERMEKQLEADLAKEKEAMKNDMRRRRNKVLKDIKAKYMNELSNRQDLTKDQQDVLLKKKYEEEMARFEAALAKESKEQQFRRLREKLILKRLEAEKDKELKRRDARINKQMREEEDKDDGRRKRGKAAREDKSRGKSANLLRQLTDAMTERIEDEYAAPRKAKENINVMLKNFKDRVIMRQAGEIPGTTVQKKNNLKKLAKVMKAKKELEGMNIPKTKVFDDICKLYIRYQENDFEGYENEFDRLLRRIIRVENIAYEMSESKVQQLINRNGQNPASRSKKK